MDTVIRTRLNIIKETVESMITSGHNILLQLFENNTKSEEALVIAGKLRAQNERFVSEIYNYYKLVQDPSADEVAKYTEIQMKAEELVAEIEVRSQQSKTSGAVSSLRSSEENINVTRRLPRMELARFDGDVLKWHQFWDQFSSNVDSRNISDVDKLLYLQTVLQGEAKQAIDGLDTTNKNYNIAIETLKERFGKPSTIIDAHYVALYRIKIAGKSVKECRQVLNEIERHLRVLDSLGEDVNHNHLRVMIMEKFPEDLIYELRIKLGHEEESIQNIRKNLEHIISARETSTRLKRHTESDTGDKSTILSHIRSESKENKISKKRAKSNVRNEINLRKEKKSKLACIFCEKDHYNDECTNVKTIQERKSKLMKRCYNCFKKGHNYSNCQTKKTCHHCGKLHNRALCPDKVSFKDNTNSFHINTANSITILQTAIVKVSKLGDSSKSITCRILLDCGSQRSYITKRVVKELKLPNLEDTHLSVFTFGAKSPQVMESPIVKFQMLTRTNKTKQIYANVVPHITENIPCPHGNIQNIENILDSNINILADDGSRKDDIDILLGNDYYYSFVSTEKIEVMKNLFLVKTEFGWVWSGICLKQQNDKGELTVLTYFQSDNESGSYFYEPDLPLRNDNVKKLWDLESIGITDSPKTSRDEEAIKQFNETTEYINNRYYVKWPWTEYPPVMLPINLGLAKGRLVNLIKRLDTDTIRAYDKVLQEQLQKGIIEKVDQAEFPINHPVHYLPHHCVLKEDKSTKLRIVYDASAKIKDYCSLNECLYKGPLMLEDLTGLIIRFREHNIGIVADVQRAFLQVGLQSEDRDVTRFLWIKDINKEIDSDNICHFRFCRVPFGIVSSPFLLNATVKYHLNKTNNNKIKQVSEDIYVDNLVTGAQSVKEAISLYKTAKTCFDEISMNLRDWNSNSENFINQIQEQYRDTNNTNSIKILGIEWNVKTDELSLKPNYNVTKNIITKREILRVIASIYDPCGFVAPIVLPAKILMQGLWIDKYKWDEGLPLEILNKWKNILYELKQISVINIPRCYGNKKLMHTSNNKYELHCFSDASMKAYAAVVYLREYNENQNNVSVSFVIGKSRLAPIKDQKDIQIPRLELLGAVIGNRLLQYVSKFLRQSINKQYLWTDSNIVLNWYNSVKLLPPFVSRRVSEIKKNKDLIIKYVPTKLNPADGATRTINSITNNNYWISGPEFLKFHSNEWPAQINRNDERHTQIQTSSVGEDLSENRIVENTENRKISDITETQTKEKTIEKITNSDTIIEDNEIIRNNNLTRKESNNEIDMNTENRQEKNETNTLKTLQRKHFQKEIQGIKTDLFKSLNLFVDKEGLLRCGGRFQNSGWPEDKKFPILLPKNCPFTEQVIENTHKENYHVGVNHTLAIIRTKYWIIHGRSQVQKVLKNCYMCRKYGGGPYKMPLMPPLPVERVKYSLPYTFTGLDYFGPLKVKEDNGSNTEKRWVCLFTCLAVRAIHMEVVKDLSAEECLMAIRRFVASRGLPQVIISDNATQFKLTSEVLKSEYCIKNKISWRFIPELAPWFGGFYERLIGLVKHCLKRTLDKHLINHNQLCTVIKEIEAVINTRPLTPVSQDLDQILTPANFLCMGGALITEISDIEFLENATVTKDNLIEGWKRGQTILQEYVKMFSSQYLTSLRERQNTLKQARVVVNKIPKVGDIVQIKGDHSRTFWKVGRISEVIKGSDDQIRVAKIMMPNGEILTRSIGHLYPLEMENDKSENHNNLPVPVNDTHIHKPPATPDQTRSEQSDKPSYSDAEPTSSTTRPSRIAAQKARDKVKQWTQQLLSIIM